MSLRHKEKESLLLALLTLRDRPKTRLCSSPIRHNFWTKAATDILRPHLLMQLLIFYEVLAISTFILRLRGENANFLFYSKALIFSTTGGMQRVGEETGRRGRLVAGLCNYIVQYLVLKGNWKISQYIDIELIWILQDEKSHIDFGIIIVKFNCKYENLRLYCSINFEIL